MSKVAVVTDSTAYIPIDLVKKYDITVVPQILIFGEETFKDGVDMRPTEFYNRLVESEVKPTTSQAAVADFKELFDKLYRGGKDILCVLISEQLSKTVNSAELARQMIPEANIEILDSESVAMALGFQVLAAAQVAAEGASLAECKVAAESAKEKTGVVFVVDTLEYLHRGGRIGGASRFLGTALKIKPILEVRDGRIEALEKVRTKSKAHDRLVEIITERVNGRGEVHLAALHANALEDARKLLNETGKKLNAIELVFSEVSPVVGTHCGPGTVGIAYMVE